MGCCGSKGSKNNDSTKGKKNMAITDADLQEIEYRRRTASLLEPLQNDGATNTSAALKKLEGRESKLSKRERDELLQLMKKEKEESSRLQQELEAKIKAAEEDDDEEAKTIKDIELSMAENIKAVSLNPRSSMSKHRQSKQKHEEDDESDKALKAAAEGNVKNKKSSSQKGKSTGSVSTKGIIININPPSVCSGYMSKQGQVFRSWKTRFFVLKEGTLTYYTGEGGSRGSQEGENQVGSPLCLKGYCVTQPAPGQLFLSIPGRKGTIADSMSHGTRGRTTSTVQDIELSRCMLVQVNTAKDLDMWEKALNEHIDYMNKISGE